MNYTGTLAGKDFVCEEPTMGSLAKLEEYLAIDGHELADAKTLPKLRMSMLLAHITCVKWGDADGIALADLESLPVSCFSEVAEALSTFQLDF